jgi:hypothetical protein
MHTDCKNKHRCRRRQQYDDDDDDDDETSTHTHLLDASVRCRGAQRRVGVQMKVANDDELNLGRCPVGDAETGKGHGVEYKESDWLHAAEAQSVCGAYMSMSSSSTVTAAHSFNEEYLSRCTTPPAVTQQHGREWERATRRHSPPTPWRSRHSFRRRTTAVCPTSRRRSAQSRRRAIRLGGHSDTTRMIRGTHLPSLPASLPPYLPASLPPYLPTCLAVSCSSAPLPFPCLFAGAGDCARHPLMFLVPLPLFSSTSPAFSRWLCRQGVLNTAAP